MRNILRKKHQDQLEQEKFKFCYDAGSIDGDVTIYCEKNEVVKTQSAMLILCSGWYGDYQSTLKTEDKTINLSKYNQDVVINVLKTYYAQPVSLFPKWKYVKQYFELAEFLIPHETVIEKISFICDVYINHIDHLRELNTTTKFDQTFLDTLRSYKSEDINKITEFLSHTDNKYVKKIADAFNKIKSKTNKFDELGKVLYALNGK